MITAVPTPAPYTMPVAEPTVPMVVLALVQVPPPVASDKVNVLPWHTGMLPDMATGCVFTVATAVA